MRVNSGKSVDMSRASIPPSKIPDNRASKKTIENLVINDESIHKENSIGALSPSSA